MQVTVLYFDFQYPYRYLLLTCFIIPLLTSKLSDSKIKKKTCIILITVVNLTYMKKEYTLEQSEIGLKDSDKLVVMPYAQDDMGIHDHHFFELVYITGGSAVHTLNDVKGKVRRGDYFIVDYGSVHSYTDCRDFTLINCLFLPEIIDDTLAGCHSFDTLMRVCLVRYYKQYFGLTPVNRIFRDEEGRILELLSGIQREYVEKRVGYTEIFRCRLMELLILTMRSIVHEDRQKPRSTAILEAIHFLDRNYADRSVLGKFCQEHHYSLQYISRRFKQETGMTALEYLQKVRIEKSCELLAGSDLRIQEIARMAGYEDVQFFSSVFRRLLNMSPREYRRMTLAEK